MLPDGDKRSKVLTFLELCLNTGWVCGEEEIITLLSSSDRSLSSALHVSHVHLQEDVRSLIFRQFSPFFRKRF